MVADSGPAAGYLWIEVVVLLQLTIENYRSFRDEAVLSLLAAPSYAHRLAGDRIEIPGVGPVLRTVALLGPNASGKSTVVQALEDLCLLAAFGVRPERGVDHHPFHEPFSLSPEYRSRPTRWEAVIHAGGQLWTYGIAVDAQAVYSERLRVGLPGAERDVFSRATNRGSTRVRWGPGAPSGSKRRQFLDFVAAGCRPQQPLLAELRDRNVTECASITEWFANVEVADDVDAFPERFAVALAAIDPSFAAWLSDFLADYDLSVDEVVVHRGVRAVHLDTLADAVAAAERGELSLQVRPHGSDVLLEWDALSSGTQHLISLGGALHPLHSGEAALVAIDEIDRSLHTAVSRRIVDAVRALPGAGQLLFTTHDTRLLDERVLATDAVWFVDKVREGASRLYALSEFDRDQIAALSGALDLGYLQGRFGAIPHIYPPLAGEP